MLALFGTEGERLRRALLGAISDHERALRHDARRLEPVLVELRAVLFRVSEGQDGASPEPSPDHQQDVSMSALLVSTERAADRLDMSTSSVKRLIRCGALPAVKIGGATRVRAADLEAFFAGLATIPSPESEGAA